jgi:hypothetical protein
VAICAAIAPHAQNRLPTTVHVVHILQAMHSNDALAATPDPVGYADGGSLSLDEWMKEDGLDDGRVGEMVGKDRTTVYRIRTGKTKPSFDFIDSIVTASGGRVQPNSFFKRALARAAASRGGDAPGPFNSTSSPQGRRLVARGTSRRRSAAST